MKLAYLPKISVAMMLCMLLQYSASAQVTLMQSHKLPMTNGKKPINLFTPDDILEDYNHNFYFFSQDPIADGAIIQKVNSLGFLVWEKTITDYYEASEETIGIDSTGIYMLTLRKDTVGFYDVIKKFDFEMDSIWTRNLWASGQI